MTTVSGGSPSRWVSASLSGSGSWVVSAESSVAEWRRQKSLKRILPCGPNKIPFTLNGQLWLFVCLR